MGAPTSAQVGVTVTVITDGPNTGNIPIVPIQSDYVLQLSDAGKAVYHPPTDTTPRTVTIPANAAVAFPVGAAVTFDNDIGAGALSIACADTLVLVGDAGTTGTRTLAAGGNATAIKVTATRWRINGSLLT